MIGELDPEVIFLDIRMPSGTEGLDLLADLEGLNPVTRLPQGRLYFLSPLHLR